MTDTALAPEQGDDSRKAEWDRLDAQDNDRQADAPGSDLPEQPEGGGGTGQASSPPAGPAAGDQPAGSDTAATDPWADAPPALKAEWEKAQNLIRTQTGRLQATERRFAELHSEVATLREKVKPAQEEQREAGPVLGEEQKATLREEFPDVAGPLLDAIGALEQRVEHLTAAGATQAEQREAADQLEVQRFLAEQEQRLAQEHPDWTEVVAKPEFATWAQAQPRYIREALVRNGNGIQDADESIDILARFKASMGRDPVAARREAQLNGGRVPQARTTVPTPSTTTDRESEWKRLDALERQRNGARSTR